jgi:hypothetical protein
MRAKPAVVNGEPRSLTKTKGDDGLSRWSLRRARSSSAWIGWVLGVPFLTRRTWSDSKQRRRADPPHAPIAKIVSVSGPVN